MTVVPPKDDTGNTQDPYREDHGLDEAKKKLDAIKGRPFEVDKVLAAHDARQQRSIEVRREADAKLKEVRAKALQRQHEIRAAQVLKENQTMLKKELDRDEADLRRAKKTEAKRLEFEQKTKKDMQKTSENV